MNLFWAFIFGLVAALLSNIAANTLERWMNKYYIYKNLPVGWKVFISTIAFLVISITAYFLQSTPTNNTFGFQIRVQNKHQKAIANAKVIIDVEGNVAPKDDFTDTNGLARIFIDSERADKPGRLIIEAGGYNLYIQNIDLSEDKLPKIIQLVDIIQEDKPLATIETDRIPRFNPSPSSQPFEEDKLLATIEAERIPEFAPSPSFQPLYGPTTTPFPKELTGNALIVEPLWTLEVLLLEEDQEDYIRIRNIIKAEIRGAADQNLALLESLYAPDARIIERNGTPYDLTDDLTYLGWEEIRQKHYIVFFLYSAYSDIKIVNLSIKIFNKKATGTHNGLIGDNDYYPDYSIYSLEEIDGRWKITQLEFGNGFKPR